MTKLITFFSRNNAYLLLFFYCGLAGVFIRYQDTYSLKSILSAGTEFRAAISHRISDVSIYLSLGKVNENLTRQNSKLLADVIRQGNMIRETERNGQAALFMTDSPVSMIPARIVERRFNTRENLLIINAGSKQGVEEDMAVLTPDGIVGRIIQVSNNYAKVMPVLHSDFSVSVISDSNKTQGILRWNGEKEQIAQMHYVPLSSSVHEKEKLFTADFSTFALRGIPVGNIVEIVPEKRFYRINVELDVDFSSLTHVLVAKKSTDPEKVGLMQGDADEGEHNPVESERGN